MENDPSFFNHPRHKEYSARVRELEQEGLSTSDAQGVADMEFSPPRSEKPVPAKTPITESRSNPPVMDPSISKREQLQEVKNYFKSLIEDIKRGNPEKLKTLLDYYQGKSSRWSFTNLMLLMLQGVRHPVTTTELPKYEHKLKPGAKLASILVPVAVASEPREPRPGRETENADELLGLSDTHKNINDWLNAHPERKKDLIQGFEWSRWSEGKSNEGPVLEGWINSPEDDALSISMDPTHPEFESWWSQRQEDFFEFVSQRHDGEISAWVAQHQKKSELVQASRGGVAMGFVSRAVVADLGRNTTGPDLLQQEKSADSGKVFGLLKLVAQERGIRTELVKPTPNAGGTASLDNSKNRVIRIDPSLSPESRCKTMAHELAHHALHIKDGEEIEPRTHEQNKVLECEAEAVAYIVCRSLRIPAGYSPSYLQLWGVTEEDLMKRMQTVCKCSQDILRQSRATMSRLMEESKAKAAAVQSSPRESTEEPLTQTLRR